MLLTLTSFTKNYDTLLEAQQAYQTLANVHHKPTPEFPIGSFAYVKVKFFQMTRPSKKLTEKFLGPFEIIAHHGTYSFTLRLPDHMQSIHPVFHASMLEPTSPNTIPNRVQPPPALVVIDGGPEFEILDVLDSKIDKQRKACKLLYLVHWTGYEGTDEETSWILTSELDHASELVQDFHKSYPAKPGPLLTL